MFKNFYDHLYTELVLDDQLLKVAGYFRQETVEANLLARNLIERYPKVVNLPRLSNRTLLYTVAIKPNLAEKLEQCIILLNHGANPNVVVRYDDSNVFTILSVCFTNAAPESHCFARFMVSYGMQYFIEEEAATEDSEEDSIGSVSTVRVPIGQSGENVMNVEHIDLCRQIFEIEQDIKNCVEIGAIDKISEKISEASDLINQITQFEESSIDDPQVRQIIISDYERRLDALNELLPNPVTIVKCK